MLRQEGSFLFICRDDGDDENDTIDLMCVVVSKIDDFVFDGCGFVRSNAGRTGLFFAPVEFVLKSRFFGVQLCDHGAEFLFTIPTIPYPTPAQPTPTTMNAHAYNNHNHGKWPRRSTRKHHDGGSINKRTMMRRSNHFPFYFLCCLAMTFIQAVGMILLGLCFSYSLHDNHHHHHHHNHGPMENIFIRSQNLWIQHYHDHHFHKTKGLDDDEDARPPKDVLLLANTDSIAERHAQQSSFLSVSMNVTINEVLEQLLQAMTNDTSTAALDDYYRRRSRTTKTATAVMDRDELPILIIGGSDGSGTRAFADLVAQLRVPMLVDDPGTLDVHAPVMFSQQQQQQQQQPTGGEIKHHKKKQSGGWPPLVRLVLEETHSADYQEETDLSSESLQMALQELRRFQLSYAPRVKDLLQNATEHHESMAKAVQYGFKAPVSMLLLPLLRKTLGRIKFLHVVRDGRDVSFSRNTSPVSKFYTSYYRNATDKLDQIQVHSGGVQSSNASAKVIQAMQLWNDWNRQVWDWERRAAEDKDNNFDFLVLRTEDLLLSPETKLESLIKLADFVGSPLTTQELCCLSRQAVVDMGQSGVGMNGKRTRHRGALGVSQPDADDYSVLRGQPNDIGGDDEEAIVDYLDDPSDITLEDVALESERKALNLALEKRPQLFQRIQQARKDNFATHHHRNEKLRQGIIMAQHQQQPPRDSNFQDSLANGLRQIWGGESEGNGHTRRHPPVRRRLLETTNGNVESVYDDVNERVTELVERKDAGDHARGHGHKEPRKRRRQTPEMVLQRYGKWKSALEGRPELSRILHEEGGEALRIFGYEPPRRFADLPPKGLPLCPASCPGT
eukprot:scaffold37050_cov199-Amphora_coffeaeformis.AAC.4